MSAESSPPVSVSEGVHNRRWVLPQGDQLAAAELSRAAQVPLVIAELLVARGIASLPDAERFLHPDLSHLLDPYSMKGMDAAVRRVQAAISGSEPVLIYGDYDVDGTTAVVLLKTAIEMLGGTVRYHVPHRLREGYGMQREVLERAAEEGVRLVISVDTGIRAFAAAEAAEALGLELIVTDHHLPEEALGVPRALAVLNPNQDGCGYACKGVCGAGVAFKLSQALLEAAFDRERVRGKILPSFLKLLAIATVADAVPLTGESRVFVSLGLEALRRPASVGLRALLAQAEPDPAKRELSAVDIGFRLGPRINAAGRMDVASDVVELFTTRDRERARELAEKLERLNTERRATERSVLDALTERLKEPEFREARCIVIDGEGWHRGVIGILASRIVDATGKPALVIAHEGGEAYGSGRSIESFHLLSALEHCHELFTRFGGHAHAVGFSLPSERVDQLRQAMVAHAAAHIRDEDLAQPLRCHAELPLSLVTPALHKWLRLLEPMGMGNEEPVFIARSLRLAAPPRYMKEKHVRLQLAAAANSASISALGWHWGERVCALGLQEGDQLDIAYKLRKNEHPEYGGLELEIVDLHLLR